LDTVFGFFIGLKIGTQVDSRRWLVGSGSIMSATGEHADRVAQLVEMGFARDKAISALKRYTRRTTRYLVAWKCGTHTHTHTRTHRANNDIEVAMNFLVEVDGQDGGDEVPALLDLAGDESIIRAELPLNRETGFTGIPYNNYSQAYANPTAPTAQQVYTPPLSAATFASAPKSSVPGHVPVAQPAVWGSDASALDNPEPMAGGGSAEDQQLRQALALSLKEQQQALPLADSARRIHGVSKEDEEMARAIEQSLQAEGGGGDFGLGDNKDPRKLVKGPGAAVGLKNIGNTCYCNSLLQTYWAIAAFREAIIRSPVPALRSGGEGVTTSGRICDSRHLRSRH